MGMGCSELRFTLVRARNERSPTDLTVGSHRENIRSMVLCLQETSKQDNKQATKNHEDKIKQKAKQQT